MLSVSYVVGPTIIEKTMPYNRRIRNFVGCILYCFADSTIRGDLRLVLFLIFFFNSKLKKDYNNNKHSIWVSGILML